MRGTHSVLTVTTTVDDATGDERPLFAFPITVAKATGEVDVKLDRATPNGSKYDTVYRDQITGEIFENVQMVRGVRQGDSFAIVQQEQIEAIDAATKMADMRVEGAGPVIDVPMDRATGVYYLQAPPEGGSHKAYRLLYEALREQPPKGKAKARPAMALRVKFTSRTRQKLGALYADETRGCLVLVALSFAAELRAPDEMVLAPQQVQVEQKQVTMCRKVVEALARDNDGDFDTPVDDAIELKRDLWERAAAGEAIEAAPVPVAVTTVADELASVLQASVEAMA